MISSVITLVGGGREKPHPGINPTIKLLCLVKTQDSRDNRVQWHRFICEMCLILPKLAIFTPMLPITQNILQKLGNSIINSMDAQYRCL